ncbi:WSC domain-containing protein like [Verticillium longisporum]|uniref:WSC domain-containing protein like n=1 Tax=Verticillium longisporum TaxID=100787 RepID=A0A8I2ZUP9_VERLO|nr:WSC domain-containing protein like [Verticillium longisporum]
MKPLHQSGAVLLTAIASYAAVSHAAPSEYGGKSFSEDLVEASPFQLVERAFELGSCRAWSRSNAWDTCQDYLKRYGLTMAQFYKLNPTVQSDCYAFVPGETYCRRTNAEIPVSKDGGCGLRTGNNVTCINSEFGDCCGANNRCGSTECGSTAAECGAGKCQSGACDGSAVTTSNAPVTTATATSTKPAPTPFTPSPDGTCGYDNKYKCTDTKYNYGNCCGAAGYCGFSDWECSNLQGCQSEYGLCDTTVLVSGAPKTTSTSPVTTTQPTTTTTSKPVAVQKSGSYELVGCWNRPPNARALNVSYTDDLMTVEKCLAKAAGYAYAGVEFGKECWYSNTIDGGYSVALSACNMPCPGAPDKQLCGAGNRMLMYKLPGNTVPQPTQPAMIVVGTRVAYRWYYVECRTDGSANRSLTGAQYSQANMTLHECANLCLGFDYFGAEFGKECYCGDTFAAGSAVSANDCTLTCVGNRDQYCGAGNRMSVYQNR